MEEFISLAGNTLAEMRLMIEGAITLYESCLSPLYQAAIREGRNTDAMNLNTLETALRKMEGQICELQSAQIQALVMK